MYNHVIKAPATTKSHYRPKEREALMRALKAVETKYAPQILQASLCCMVPPPIITSFIFVQSAGNEKLVSQPLLQPSKAYGLMQLTPETAANIIYLEAKEDRLNATERELLVKYVGKDRIDCYTQTMQGLGPDELNKCRPLKAGDMLIPGFNILIGTMLISRLMDETREGEEGRLDKVYLKFSQGMFYKIKSKPGSDIDTILKEAQKAGGKSYTNILKITGKNGLMDLLT